MSLEWKWFVGFVMGGCRVTHGDNGGPLKCMRYYCWWRPARFVCLSHKHRDMYAGITLPLCTHSHAAYNRINGGVSLTLINYNQIKDFISLNFSLVCLVIRWISAVRLPCMTFPFSFLLSSRSSLWNNVLPSHSLCVFLSSIRSYTVKSHIFYTENKEHL